MVTVATNSFISMADAATYFATRFNSGSWDSASDANKSGSILGASAVLDSLEYVGTPNVSTQAMVWPRSGVVTRNGTAESSTLIPTRVQNATCELAFSIIKTNYKLTPDIVNTRGSTRLGSLTSPAKIKGVYSELPPAVTRELRGLLLSSGVSAVRVL